MVKIYTESGIECATLEEAKKIEANEKRRDFINALMCEMGITKEHEDYREYRKHADFIFDFAFTISKTMKEQKLGELQ